MAGVGAVSSQTRGITDPRDLNGDGTVSASELQAYDQRQARQKALAAPREAQAASAGSLVPGQVDLLA